MEGESSADRLYAFPSVLGYEADARPLDIQQGDDRNWNENSVRSFTGFAGGCPVDGSDKRFAFSTDKSPWRATLHRGRERGGALSSHDATSGQAERVPPKQKTKANYFILPSIAAVW